MTVMHENVMAINECGKAWKELVQHLLVHCSPQFSNSLQMTSATAQCLPEAKIVLILKLLLLVMTHATGFLKLQ